MARQRSNRESVMTRIDRDIMEVVREHRLPLSDIINEQIRPVILAGELEQKLKKARELKEQGETLEQEVTKKVEQIEKRQHAKRAEALKQGEVDTMYARIEALRRASDDLRKVVNEVYRQGRASGIAENMLHPIIGQRPDNHFRAGHLFGHFSHSLL